MIRSEVLVYSTNLLKPCISEQTKIANFLTAIDEKAEFKSQMQLHYLRN
jgi:hypothetical protein